jgi:hypothetical protein
LRWHLSPVQPAIIKTVRKKEKAPQIAGAFLLVINLLNGRLCSKKSAKMGLF